MPVAKDGLDAPRSSRITTWWREQTVCTKCLLLVLILLKVAILALIGVVIYLEGIGFGCPHHTDEPPKC